MAKYSVTYSCGHSGEVQLFGSHRERENKLAWYREVAVCPDCYRAQRAAENAALTAGLPALTGTEKQVAWAEDLRAQLIREFEAQVLGRIPASKRDEALGILRRAMAKQTDACWWIDNRDRLLQAIAPLCEVEVRACAG